MREGSFLLYSGAVRQKSPVSFSSTVEIPLESSSRVGSVEIRAATVFGFIESRAGSDAIDHCSNLHRENAGMRTKRNLNSAIATLYSRVGDEIPYTEDFVL